MLTRNSLMIAAAAFAIAAVSTAVAQQTSQSVGALGENEGIFVSGKDYTILKGKGEGDVAAKVAKLNAKEIGPGVIVFRMNNKLYAAQGQPIGSGPQGMKDFQDGFTNYMKDFQDTFTMMK